MKKFYNCLPVLLLSCALMLGANAIAQELPKPIPNPPKNWHEMDFKTDGFYGVSLKQAYQFLKGKKSKTVIVTTIDSGIDTLQKDLVSVLWVNPREIPGNGIDDDHNGFIDDVHGWDFLGGKGGKIDYTETNEEVRQYYKLKAKFAGATTAPPGLEKEYASWQHIKAVYDSTISRAQNELKELTTEVNVLTATNYYLKRELKLQSDQTFTKADLGRIQTQNDTINQSKTVWDMVFTSIGDNPTNAK